MPCAPMMLIRAVAVTMALSCSGVSAQEDVARNIFVPAAPRDPSELRAQPAETMAAARVDPNWPVPRTEWGHPDLQGLWTSDDMRSVPVNRPEEYGLRMTLDDAEFAGRAARDEGGRDRALNRETLLRNEVGVRTFGYTSMVVDPPDGRVPELTASAQTRADARGPAGGPFDTVEDFSLYDRCITRGILGSILPVIYGNGVRIVQTPNSVVLSYEMVHDTRIVPLDGSALPGPDIRQYMGVSNGRWDGDTLVIETANLTGKTAIGPNGNGPQHSAGMKLTERLTRIDPEMIDYIVHVDDPDTYSAPFTLRMTITTQPGYDMFEYSCHEGNRAVRNALRGERAYEAAVAAAIANGEPVPERSSTGGIEIYQAPGEDAAIFDVNAGQ